MSITWAVILGMVAAMGVAVVAVSFAYPTGIMAGLWQEISPEERARFGILPNSRWQRVGSFLFNAWVICYLSADMVEIVWHVKSPMVAFFHSGTSLAVASLYYVALLVFNLRWSWRVRRLTEGACSAPLRRLARWTFSLNAGACGLLLALALAVVWVGWLRIY